MARLLKNPVEDCDISWDEDWKEALAKERAREAELFAASTLATKENPKNFIFRSPFADSYAMYRVESFNHKRNTVSLRHIPLGDGWSIPAAHMRGLRLSDILGEMKREKIFRDLYAEKNK